mgnify:FL=1|jgi:ABC-type Fe3+-hydroxamate transport system substrate-binding protein
MEMGAEWTKRLASYVYKLERFQHITGHELSFRHEPSLHELLFIVEADGEFMIDGRKHVLHRQSVYVVPPDADAALFLDTGGRTDLYAVRFHVLKAAEHGRFVPASLHVPVEWITPHFPVLIGKLEELDRTIRREAGGWETMRANILFQEVLVTLFEGCGDGQTSEWNQAIALAVDYMERNYHLGITREKLAEMAGLSEDYFSRLFKKLVHKSPMEYLTEIRMNQAKQLLVQSGRSLRAIAQRVGYSDEFYFSRKFKAEIGCSPMAFVKKVKSSCRIASLNHLSTGHLMALGIEPYAAVINGAFPVTAGLRCTIALGQSRPDLERLATAKPDLIVVRGTRQGTSLPQERLLHTIAPTVTLEYFSDWRAHLLTIAKLVGKEEEARQWLDRYGQKVETFRNRMNHQLGDATFLIVGIGAGKLCIYGQRNLGSVLYGDLGLAAPPGVQNISHYREVTLGQLAEFDPDRILLTNYKHDGTARMDRAVQREAEALFAHPQWQALKAVRNKQVYHLLDNRHLYTSYNALSHDLLLEKLYRMLIAETAGPLLASR